MKHEDGVDLTWFRGSDNRREYCMWETFTCPRATQDVERVSVRGTHRVGRAAPLAMPCRDNSAIAREIGSLLSPTTYHRLLLDRDSRLGDLVRPFRSATRRRMAPAFCAASEAQREYHYAPDGRAIHDIDVRHLARLNRLEHSGRASPLLSQRPEDAEPLCHQR